MFKNKTLTERLLALALCLVLLVGLMPTDILQASAVEGTGTVTAITEGLTVTDDGNGNVTVKGYADAAFEKRYVDDSTVGLWAGVQITAPEGVDTANATVTYTDSSSNESSGKFNDYKTSADSNSAAVWACVWEGSVDATPGGISEHHWRVDWNGDGTAELKITLSVTILSGSEIPDVPDVGGPVLCAGVKNLQTGESIAAAKEMTVAVGVDQVTYNNGWSVGIGVTAPAGADLTAATYTVNGKTDNITKDYTELWVSLQNDGSGTATVDTTWSFDWDADGVEDQSVTMTTGTAVKLAKGTQEAPKFAQDSITISFSELKAQGWEVTNSITNTSEGAVKYSVSDTNVVRSISDGKPFFSRSKLQPKLSSDTASCTVTISAYFEETDTYSKSEVGSYTIKVTPGTLSPFSFAENTVEVRYGDDNFTKTVNYQMDGTTTGIAVEYSSSDENVAKVDSASGEVAVKGVGKTTITATGKVNGYKTATATYEVVVKEASRDDFAFVAPVTSIEYAEKLTQQYTVTGVQEGEKVAFAISNEKDSDGNGATGKIASVNDTGLVTVKGAGSFTLTAAVTGNAGYEDKSVSIDVTVTKAQLVGFGFNITQDFMDYSENLVVVYPINGLKPGTKPVVGLTKGGEEYAEVKLVEQYINEKGELVDGYAAAVTIKKAGSFSLTLAVSGTSNFSSVNTHEAMTITVNRAAQKPLTFVNTSLPREMVYNPDDNQLNFAVTGGSGTSATVYSVSNTDVAEIDNNGHLTVKTAGKITVTVSKAGDENYKDAVPIQYELTISKYQQGIEFAETSIVRQYGEGVYQQLATICSEYSNNGTIVYSVDTEHTTLAIDAFLEEKGIIDLKEDATGTITIRATLPGDDCYDKAIAEYTLTVQYAKTPEVAYTLEPAEPDGNDSWYKSAVNICAPEGYEISYSNDPEGTWAPAVVWEEQGFGTPVIYLKKTATGGITEAVTVETLKVDTVAPNCSITYGEGGVWKTVMASLTFGFYKSETTVTIAAEDQTSGVAAIYYRLSENDEWTEKTFTADEEKKVTFPIAPQYRGQVQFYAVDAAGVESAKQIDNKIVVVDDISPTMQIEYEYAMPDTDTGAAMYENGGIIYTRYAVKATLTVEEDNFDLIPQRDRPTIKLDSKPYPGENEYLEWTRTEVADADGNVTVKWVATVEITGEGDHLLSINFADQSTNPMVASDGDGSGAYGIYTQTIYIDSTAPVVRLNEELNGVCTNQSVTATIEVQDANFSIDDQYTQVMVVSKDINGNVLKEEDLSSRVKWCASETDAAGNVIHKGELTLSGNANYTLNVTCTDKAGNVSDTASQSFTVEKVKPTDVRITYSAYHNFWKEVVNGVTFGFYTYNPDVQVTLTATDTISGVDSFTWTYTVQEGASSVNAATKTVTVSGDQIKRSGSSASYTFTLPLNEAEQLRGSISVVVKDYAGNQSSNAQEADQVGSSVVDRELDNNINIVDTKKPTRTVTWSEAKQVAVSNGTSYRYYSDQATATIQITEANFYGEDVKVYDNNTLLTVSNWTRVASGSDTWQAAVTLSNAGDHVLTVKYTDRSANVMDVYTSETIVIDHTDPAVSVSYSNNNVINTVNGRDYYDAVQTATITIVEHNFRAGDVKVLVSAKNVVDADVAVTDYAKYAATAANWISDGDTHKLTLVFAADANYTFDVEYADLALRNSNDLPQRLFTVDMTAPANLTVSYSSSLLGTVLNGITFGFYNAPMTVTITAQDETAGIHQFVYSYIKNTGVSSVNAELLNDAISSAQIQQEGKTFTATFQIPKSVLTSVTQFNGTVAFTAADRSGNESNMADQKTIIVDNIRPVANVSFNTPVQTVNSVAYYDGSIQTTIQITEANFYGQDVQVYDNGRQIAVSNWTKVTGDTWQASVTLADAGEHLLTVEYTDRSANKMDPFTSQKMIVDTEAPVVQVSGVENEASYADQVISFTITASDDNFDVNAFKPVLKALVLDENGVIQEVEPVEFSEHKQGKNGEYIFEIENLEQDGIYTLVCEVTDLAGNSTSVMELEDGKTYEQVRFSVNRDGSAFGLDDYTVQLIENYYNRNVTENVVVYEVNADELEERTVTLNGEELAEGTDYTVTVEGGSGAWMKYTYTINKELFAQEGEYQLVVSTKDEAGNTAFSDVKGAVVNFIVDRTAPVVTITGMTDNGRYQTDSHPVTLIPTDDGGALKSIVVRLVDDKGNVQEELLNLSGAELTQALESGEGVLTFNLGEGQYERVQIICEDTAAGDEGSNVFSAEFRNLTVSSSSFVIFWANTALRNGVIICLLLLVLIMVYLLTRKSKKKSKAKAA